MTQKRRRRRRARAMPTKNAPRAAHRPSGGQVSSEGQPQLTAAEACVLERRQDYLERLWTYYFESLGVEESRKDAGNPLNVWRAYLECRAHKLPIPDWVLSYLDRVARRFWNLSLADSPFIRADAPDQDGLPDPATAIAEALEMKRPGRSGAGNPKQLGRPQGLRASSR